MHRLLLCPPDFYTVRYEINPWMSRAREVNHALACDQWAHLCRTLAGLKQHMKLVPAEKDWPDMVFTANAGLVQGRRVMLGNFRFAERAGEQHGFEQWFRGQGFEVTRVPPRMVFEGEGDALWFNGTLVCAHGYRTDRAAHEIVRTWCGAPILSVALADPRYYHLDTCFCPLDTRSAMWHPGAFDEASRKALQALIPDLIEVPAIEAECFACNAIVLGRDVVIPEGCAGTGAALKHREFRTHEVPMSEFIKAGGACKCLVLHLR
jgi:N-dimethylarginine dimethylaminohydrolase